MNCAEVKLVLVDSIEEVIDDRGEEHYTDSPEVLLKSEMAIRSMSEGLGKPEKNLTRGTRSDRSHQFGGHEVLQTTVEFIFALQGAGLIKGGFTALKEWIALKKGRKARIEVKGKKNGGVTKVELAGYTEAEVLSILQHAEK